MARKRLDTLGLMIDMSRNAVMRPDAVKQYMGYMKKMGYNTAEEFNQRLMQQMESEE